MKGTTCRCDPRSGSLTCSPSCVNTDAGRARHLRVRAAQNAWRFRGMPSSPSDWENRLHKNRGDSCGERDAEPLLKSTKTSKEATGRRHGDDAVVESSKSGDASQPCRLSRHVQVRHSSCRQPAMTGT